MRRPARLAVLLAAAALLPAPPPAAADAPFLIEGLGCSFASVAGPAGDQAGEIDGGPRVVTSSTASVESVTLVCTIQVDGWSHDDPDAASAQATSPGPVVVLPPTLVSYASEPASNVVLCEELRIVTAEGETRLYSDGNEWSTTATSSCVAPLPPWTDPLDLNRLFVEYVDPAVCPVLATHFPPEGDVAGLWDCPPYER